jgi:hypothetical protein
MRDLHANKSVAMHIGLINFQYVLQQGMNYYFGEAPYVLTDGYRTERTNASIENAAKKSQHLEAAASDGRFEKASIEQQFKLASWFDVGGVGIYPHHVHIDAGRRRRWAGGYHTNGQTEMINTFFVAAAPFVSLFQDATGDLRIATTSLDDKRIIDPSA